MLLTLIKKHLPEETRKNYTIKQLGAIIHCEHCNTIIYGEWEVPFFNEPVKDSCIEGILTTGENVTAKFINKDLIISIRKDIEKFLSMPSCLVCGKKYIEKDSNNEIIENYKIHICGDFGFLSFNNDFYSNILYLKNGSAMKLSTCDTAHIQDALIEHSKEITEYRNIGSISEKMKLYYQNKYSCNEMPFYNFSFYTNIDRSAREKFTDLRKKLESDNKIDLDQYSITLDNRDLKKLVSIAFQTEHDLISTRDRLITLYINDIENTTELNNASKILLLEKTRELDQLRTECERIKQQIKNKQFSAKYPNKPTKPTLPNPPDEPIYKKSNIFNKKKIALENEQLKNDYLKALTSYTEVCESIKKTYSEKITNYNLQIEKINSKKEKELNDVLALKEKELSILENEVSTISLGENDLIIKLQTKDKILKEEIAKAEELLHGLYKVKNSIYSSELIFIKYCNVVAISTFHEYLSSGRCSSLEGSDGAYNLYENELRANLVIKELSEINTSLKKIQENQCLLFNAIQETNNDLKELSSATHEAFNELSCIKTITQDIEKNTRASAYYSKVNAYYSKKNAQLTNSLGFLIALK